MSAARVRARAVLERLPAGPVRGAEVGVYDGRMSRELLAGHADLFLHMVDRWEAPTPAYAATGDPRAALSGDEMRAAMRRAEVGTSKWEDRRALVRADSLTASRLFSGLAFVFLDADHGREAVVADIEAWLLTLAPGGLLGGHDYGDRRFGVTEAVDDACDRHGWTLDLGRDKTWFVRP